MSQIFLGGRNRAVAELEFGLLGFPPPAELEPGGLALPAGYLAEEIDPAGAEECGLQRAAIHPITGEVYGVLHDPLAALAPRGVWFDGRGVMWILTDELLAADPVTGHVRRFLRAPRAAAITGVATSVDARSMRVTLQHAGQGPAPPRSVTLRIRRAGGWVIGS